MEWKIRDKDNTMGWGGGRRGVKKDYNSSWF